MCMTNTIEWRIKVEKALKAKIETNEIDFKKDLSENNERLKEHINAFGNSPTGGLFVFGVSEDFLFKDEISDQQAIIKKVENLAHDSQSPPLKAIAHHLSIDEKQLLAIEILSGSTIPVFIRNRDPWTNGAFIRSGSSTRSMTNQEIRDLMARSQNLHLDAEPLNSATIEDLDLNAIEIYLRPFRADQGFSTQNLQILEDNGVVKEIGSKYIPTIAGWLMFSVNPQKIRKFHNVFIEFQQFSGRTRENPVRKLEINGTLPQQVTLASGTLLQNVWKIPKIQGIRREDVPSYDETTLREVITNAVVHRDYKQLHQPVKIAIFSDRIEVENPGGLLPGLTPLNLLHKRDWRNETISNLMMKAGLGEMDGQGIDRIYGAVQRLKVPAPLIIADERTFKIVLSAPKAYEEYTPEEKKMTVIILLLLEQEIDNESLRNAFGVDATKASTLLKELVGEGIILRKTKSMKFARYRFTDEYLAKVGR